MASSASLVEGGIKWMWKPLHELQYVCWDMQPKCEHQYIIAASQQYHALLWGFKSLQP